jgi:hypothetical protein
MIRDIILLSIITVLYLIKSDKIDHKTGVICFGLILFVHVWAHSRREGFSSEEEVSDYEAVANFASMISDGTLKVDNIETTGDVTIGGTVSADGDMKGRSFQITGTLDDHPGIDGSFYRYSGQVYLEHDDNLYVKKTGDSSTINLPKSVTTDTKIRLKSTGNSKWISSAGQDTSDDGNSYINFYPVKS